MLFHWFIHIHIKADVYDYKSGLFGIQIIKYCVFVAVLNSSEQSNLFQSKLGNIG